MGIIDRYIIKKYIGTLTFMLLLLTIVVIVIDVQSKTPRIESNGFTIGYFLINFYPYWMLYLILTFMSILVFVSIILFTSQMANNTEIVAIIGSGASFHRFARPYFFSAGFLMLLTLGINHFILPWANEKKNELIIYTFNSRDREKYTELTSIATQLSATEYIFIDNYHQKNQQGSGYMYQKFDENKKLIHQIIAADVHWNKKSKQFILNNYLEKSIDKSNSEKLSHGEKMEQDFKLSPEELFPNDLQAENKNTIELLDFIKREQAKGNQNLNSYLNELHQRTSMPVSIFILSILALSISSVKKRGGIGLNLAIGIVIAFAFIFSFEILKIASSSQTIPPLLAMWLPNILFGSLALYLYMKRANQ